MSTPNDETFLSHVLGYHPLVETKFSELISVLTSWKKTAVTFDPVWSTFAGILACRNYLTRAHTHAKRFVALGKEIRALSSTATTPEGSGEKAERLWQRERRTLDAQSEIETVYFCLKLLLDRLATTFLFYFEIPVKVEFGSSHKKLEKAIKNGHKALGAIRPELPDSFLPRMKMLTDLVVDFRNTEIEHPGEPHHGIFPHLDWDDPDDPTCVPRMLSIGRNNEYSTTRDPAFLIAQVQEYAEIVLDVMIANKDKSFLKTQA